MLAHWVYVEAMFPSGGYVGAMFAHLGAMLGLCSPILAPCWRLSPFSPFKTPMTVQVPPLAQRNSHHLVALVASWAHVEAILAYLELCCFHDFTCIPKICFEKLPPVACASHVWMVLSKICLSLSSPSGLPVSRFWSFLYILSPMRSRCAPASSHQWLSVPRPDDRANPEPTRSPRGAWSAAVRGFSNPCR